MNLRRHVILLLIVLSLPVFLIKLGDYWPVRAVKFKGTYQYVGEQTIKNHIDEAIPDSMFSSKITHFKKAIQRIEWVKSVNIRRLWPDTLLVYFEEHEPFANWCDSGILTYEGILIRKASGEKSINPLSINLCGPEGSEQIVLNQYQVFQKILQSTGLQLHAVILSSRYSWELLLSEKLKLKLGRENILERLQHLVDHWQMFAKLLSSETVIDLRYANGVAVNQSI